MKLTAIKMRYGDGEFNSGASEIMNLAWALGS